MKITRSGSIILTSFLIAASIILFVAAGKSVQQTAQAQSSTDIVVGTTAETPKVSRQKIESPQEAKMAAEVSDLSANSLNSITFNPRWRECFTLSHENNGIIPGLLQDIPMDASKKIQQKLIQQNKVAMLFAAGVDEWVCWYYSTNFGIEDIPSYVEMQKDIDIHEETWEKLRFFLDNCIFEPTELNGAYWNDGLKQDNGNYTLVSRKTTFENVSATIIFCGDRKPVEPPQTTVTTAKPEEPVATIKNNCGNIQRPQPPEKAPILPPSKEKPKPEPCPTTTTTCPPTTTTTIPNPKPKAPENSKPETTFHHPQNPATQPVQDNKSELVKPTPGYIPGTAEKQADSPQGKNTTNPNLDSGTGTAPPGVDLSTGQQGGNAGVSSPTENPKATIETKPAPPPPAP